MSLPKNEVEALKMREIDNENRQGVSDAFFPPLTNPLTTGLPRSAYCKGKGAGIEAKINWTEEE